MRHLSRVSPLNAMVTTITSQVKVLPDDEAALDHVTGDMIYGAVNAMVRRNGYILGKKAFKNCVIFSVRAKSPRGGTRNISIKVFRNLTLHIAGAHCLEMIEGVAANVASEIASIIKVPLATRIPAISMVNYSYMLPGPVRLRALCKMLTDEHHLLVLFDPSKYAGVIVKLNLCGAMCSLIIFESRKMIISTPRCEERDALLEGIVKFIETAVVCRWETVRMA